MLLGCSLGVIEVGGLVGVWASQIECHSECGRGIHDVLNLRRNHVAALCKLFLELGNQSFGAAGVHVLKSGLGVVGDAVGNDGDGRENNQEDRQQQLGAK